MFEGREELDNDASATVDVQRPEILSKSPSCPEKKKRRRGKKRPRGDNTSTKSDTTFRYSPKAPENYTQFLISDQNDNFLDNSTEEFSHFLEAQFETDFTEARATELSLKSKAELTEIICELENKKARLLTCRSCADVEQGDIVQVTSLNTSTSDTALMSGQTAQTCLLYKQLMDLQQENVRLRTLAKPL